MKRKYNPIYRKSIKLRGGTRLEIFFNRQNNLFVVDKVRRDGSGGNEIVRLDVRKYKLPTKRLMSQKRWG